MAESDALKMAYRAEKDLNSYQAKQGLGAKSDSSMQCSCALLPNMVANCDSCRVRCERDGRQEIPPGNRCEDRARSSPYG